MNNQSDLTVRDAEQHDHLLDDLEETRARVSADVEALGTKLSPQNIKAEAKQAVTRSVERGTEKLREGAQMARTSIVGFWRENPIPLSLIGAGLGLLIYNSRKNQGQLRAGPDHAIVGRSAVYDDGEDLNGAASSKLGELKNGVKDGMQSVKRAVGATAHQAKDKFEQLEHTAREQAQHARQLADRTLEDQPLVLGAVALGAGLAVGFALPATQSENKLMGDYRERVVSNAKQRIGGVAERAVDAVQGATKSEQSAAE